MKGKTRRLAALAARNPDLAHVSPEEAARIHAARNEIEHRRRTNPRDPHLPPIRLPARPAPAPESASPGSQTLSVPKQRPGTPGDEQARAAHTAQARGIAAPAPAPGTTTRVRTKKKITTARPRAGSAPGEGANAGERVRKKAAAASKGEAHTAARKKTAASRATKKKAAGARTKKKSATATKKTARKKAPATPADG